MVNGSRKGGSFERKVAVELSEWWSDGQDDDLFWRTPGSGARATQRTKKGKKTASGSGDLMATDERGRGLMELVTFELKKGYSATTIQDTFDIPHDRHGSSQMDKFLIAAERASIESGSWTWALITERNRRLPLITFPLSGVGYGMFKDNKIAFMATHVRSMKGFGPIITVGWNDFCLKLSPASFTKGIKECQKKQPRL
jgi:hypothetical protein